MADTAKKGRNPAPEEVQQLEKEAKKQAKLDKLKQKKPAAPTKDLAEKKEKKKVMKEAALYDADRPLDDKKDILLPMPDAYNPKYVEATWYGW